MSKLLGTVAVLIVCVECRHWEVSEDLISQYKRILGVDHVFIRSAAGPDGKILRGDHHRHAIVEDTQLLIDAKGASVIGVVGHYDCAGHNVPDEDHDRDVVRACAVLRAALRFDGEIVPLVSVPAEAPHWIVRDLRVSAHMPSLQVS